MTEETTARAEQVVAECFATESGEPRVGRYEATMARVAVEALRRAGMLVAAPTEEHNALETLARVRAIADQWNETPDYSPSEYDKGRVDQRHAMAEQLLDSLAAGVAPQEPSAMGAAIREAEDRRSLAEARANGEPVVLREIDREELALERVWKAMGCAHNPDAFKPSVRDQMWDQVIASCEEQTAGNTRIYRENQQLQAALAAASSPLAAPGMVGDALALAPDPDHIERLLRHVADRRQVEDSSFVDGPEHLIYGNRQTGKTKLAIEWVLDGDRVGEDRVLLVFTEEMAVCHREAAGMRRGDSRIISWRRLLNQGPRPGVAYGIDEASEILTSILRLRRPPRLMTICTATPWQGQETPQ